MLVEILEDGQWVALANATATHIESNRYHVTITGVPTWVRIHTLDNAPLRIGQKQAFRVCSSNPLVARVMHGSTRHDHWL